MRSETLAGFNCTVLVQWKSKTKKEDYFSFTVTYRTAKSRQKNIYIQGKYTSIDPRDLEYF